MSSEPLGFDDELDSDDGWQIDKFEEHIEQSLDEIDELGPEISCANVHLYVSEAMANLVGTPSTEVFVTPLVERLCKCVVEELVTQFSEVDAERIAPIMLSLEEVVTKYGEASGEIRALTPYLQQLLYIAALSAVGSYRLIKDDYGE